MYKKCIIITITTCTHRNSFSPALRILQVFLQIRSVVTPLLCKYGHWFSNAQSGDVIVLRIVANVNLVAELLCE